jgi:flagellar motor protein MotB
MVTLLLTFFVLIIAITSIDPKSLATDGDEAIDQQYLQEILGPGALSFANPTLMDPVVSLVNNMDEIPPEAILNQEEIKAAIFQLDRGPETAGSVFPELVREASDSISVFRDERGFVIRWDKSILFPEGGTALREENLALLGRLAEFLSRLALPVSVESHTNPLSDLEGGATAYSYRLSAERSKIVLNYLVGLGISPSRFRLGAYGGARPLTLDPNLAYENSRLEIVLYKPPRSSWKG